MAHELRFKENLKKYIKEKFKASRHPGAGLIEHKIENQTRSHRGVGL